MIWEFLTGLKAARMAEWRAVLREESRSMTLSRGLKLLVQLASAGAQLATHRADRRLWRRRIRICHFCPIYDHSLRRCRPYSGSDLGCGCYVPLKAMTARQCWWKNSLPSDMPGGW